MPSTRHSSQLNYLDALRLIHKTHSPQNYVEIGCRKGLSLALAQCPAIAIDPDFEINTQIEAPVRLFKTTSDDFFANRDIRALLGGRVDLAFIDGMHQAEFVLRDFINLEAVCDESSIILIDDILPQKIEWTTRERETKAWTGDVYKVIPLLRAERPDLSIEVFDIEMKGMAVISGLDPTNRSLAKALPRHEAYLTSDASALPSVAAIRTTLAPRDTDELAPHLAGLPSCAHSATPAENYLDLLKRCVLNEIYLDDELRLLYLRNCLEGEEGFDYAAYHDIRNARRAQYEDLQTSRNIGRFPERNVHKSGFSHTMMGRRRLDSLQDCLDIIRQNNVSGDLVECGVWRGGGCIFMAGYLKAHGMQGRRVIVADSFEGLPKPSHALDAKLDLSKEQFPELAVSQQVVEENFAAYDLLDDQIVFLRGWFRDTLPHAPVPRIALLRLDGDLYESTMDALTALYDKVPEGGVVIIDDFGALEVCQQAVHDFFDQRGEPLPQVEVIDWTGVYWIKSTSGD